MRNGIDITSFLPNLGAISSTEIYVSPAIQPQVSNVLHPTAVATGHDDARHGVLSILQFLERRYSSILLGKNGDASGGFILTGQCQSAMACFSG